MTGSKKKTTVGALTIVAAFALCAVVWLVSSRDEASLADPTVARPAGERVAAMPQIATLDAPTSTPPPPSTESSTTGDARERPATEERTFLRVTVRGLHRDVPLTAPVRLEFVGLRDTNDAVHCDEGMPGSDGNVRFALPTWWQRCRHGSVNVDDPRYRSAPHHWMGSIDVENGIVLDVEVTAMLRGRVVDARGEPVDAVITAFREADGIHTAIGITEASKDGTWQMQALPDEPLLLVAQPAGHGELAMEIPYSTRFGLGAAESAPPPKVGNLLPACQRVTCKAGHVVDVHDVVVPDADELRVSVRWSDGTPMPGASLHLMPREGEAMCITDGTFVLRQVDGRLATSAFARTDTYGEASLPMLVGARADVQLMLHFGWPPATFAQPVTGASVEFRVPRPVTLRAIADGAVEPWATFAVQGRDQPLYGTNGMIGMLVDRPMRIRATRNTRCSRWIDIGPDAAGRTIDLELEPDRLRTVTLALEGATVDIATVAWRAADGSAGGEVLTWHPPAKPSLFLEPGHYTLRIGSPRTGGTLFPTETAFDVGNEATTVTVPVRQGATIVVRACDDTGRYFAGTCQVIAASGEDMTDVFAMERGLEVRRGARGEILAGGQNRLDRVLPAGEYELRVDIVGRGQRRERVVLREGDTVTVRVRL